MRDYPNMSYCMNQNTLAAMHQILNTMQEDGVDMLLDMSRDEFRAFKELFMACEDFMNRAEQLEQEYEQFCREMDEAYDAAKEG